VSPGLGFGEMGDGHVWIALVENNQRPRQAVWRQHRSGRDECQPALKLNRERVCCRTTLDPFQTFPDRRRDRISGRSTIVQAIRYVLTPWTGLTVFLTDSGDATLAVNVELSRQQRHAKEVGQNMEVKGATFLYTLAGLMITFAGFTALLLALRPAAGARLSRLDRYLAKTVMTHIIVLTAGALLPVLLALYDIQEKWIWQGSAVLFAVPMLSLQVTYPRRRRKVAGQGPPPAIFAVLVVLGAVVTLAMLGYVLAGLQHSAAAYITAVTIDFFTVAFSFVAATDIIMQQPNEVPERPAPR
jgi:hypothetical protein